ncbi:MAG: hypothetical protein ACREBW_01860, partial [Candidatus Micrarchaeaceae archaeon]
YEAYQQLTRYRRQGDMPASELLDFTVRYRRFLGMTLAQLPDITMASVVDHLVESIVAAKGLKVAASPYYIERDMDRLVNGTRHKIAYGKIAQAVRSYDFEPATSSDASYGIDLFVRPKGNTHAIPWLGLSVVPSLEEYRTRIGAPENIVYEDAAALVTSEGVAIVESVVYDEAFQGKCQLEQCAAESLAPQLASQAGKLLFRAAAQ